MKNLSEQFEHFKESENLDTVVEYLSKKPFVREVVPIIGSHYKIALGIDKESAEIFIRYLNAGGHLVDFEWIDNQPLTILSLYIPEKDTIDILKGMDFSFTKLSDFVAYKKFKKDFRRQMPDYYLTDWQGEND